MTTHSIGIGSALGAYRVVAAIGAGGMGEVYRAEDTKLGRDVALKVLPEEFANDPDRYARFEREAKVLASSNHPNIAHLYGLESAVPQAGAGNRESGAVGSPCVIPSEAEGRVGPWTALRSLTASPGGEAAKSPTPPTPDPSTRGAARARSLRMT